jgi:RecB family exonuclease
VFLALQRAGVAVQDGGAGDADVAVAEGCILHATVEVTRRVQRERTREGFFLDPGRPQSDVVGNLALGTSGALVERAVSAETGASAERALAVTSVERFAQCPFKGYAHVVLAAREPEEQRELPDAREEGNLGHSALAAAFQATSEEWPRRPRSAPLILERGLAAADRVLEETLAHAPLRAIVRLRVRESVRALLTRATEDEDWDFALAEQAFGNGKPWPIVEISDGKSGVWLRGTIDRVDRAHGRAAARVIDYKRSKSTVRESSAHLGETALQVPIYAVVASRRFEMPATGVYLPIQPRDLAAEASASAKIEDGVAALVRREAHGPSAIEKRVLQLVSDARGGRFAPLPARDAECTHCSVSGGCRKPRFAMAAADETEEGVS